MLGLAIAEAVYQQIDPGNHGPFSLSDVLEMATPLYVAPPERGGSECHCGARPTGGSRGAPAPDPGAPGASHAGGIATGFSGFRFSAWGAGTSAGAVGGGFGGW